MQRYFFDSFGKSSRRRAPARTLSAMLAAGAVLAILATPALSTAQTRQTSSEQATSDRYDELLRQADTALRSKRFKEALALWRAAWPIQQSGFVACNIGRAERLVGSAREAAEFLALCFRLSPAPTTPEEKHRHDQFTADYNYARSQVAALTITTNESGANILVDERRIGQSPLPGEVFVEPGEHRVSATLEGYERALVTIRVEPGEARAVPVVLTKPAPPSKPTPLAPVPLAHKEPPLAPVPLAHKGQPPAAPTDLSVRALAPTASLMAVGFGIGTGFLIARDDVTDTAWFNKRDMKLRFLNDCTPSALGSPCLNYFGAEQTRAEINNAAAFSFAVGGVAAAALVVQVLFPRSFIARSLTIGSAGSARNVGVGLGNGLKVSF